MTTAHRHIVKSLCSQAGLATGAVSVTGMASGQFCDAYRVDTDACGSLLLRIPREPHVDRATKERRVVGMAREHAEGHDCYGFTVTVPRILSIGPQGETLSDFVEGIPLDQVLECDAARAARAAGALLAVIHQIELPRWGIIHSDSASPQDLSWSDYLTTWMRRMCEWMPGKHAAIHDLIAAIPLPHIAPRLLHRDPSPGNFLVDTIRRRIALIDWEFAIAGDPMLDIAVFRVETADRPDLIISFQSGYVSSASSSADSIGDASLGRLSAYCALHTLDSSAFAERMNIEPPHVRKRAQAVAVDLHGTLTRCPLSRLERYCKALLMLGGVPIDPVSVQDALSRHAQLLEHLLRATTSLEQRQRVYDTVNTRILKALGVASTGHDLTRAVQGLSAEEPCVGAHELLVRLRNSSYRVVIATNGDATTGEYLQHHGFSGLYDALVVSDVVGSAKPHPLFYSAVAHALRVDLSSCEPFFVGDDIHNDCLAARRAGFRPVLIGSHLDALRRHGLLPGLDACVVNTLSDIPGVLNAFA